MFRIAIIVISIVGLCFQAQGSSEASNESSKVAGESSKAARENKKAAVGVKAGNTFGGIQGTGIFAHYFLSSSLQVGGQYIAGSLDIGSDLQDQGAVSSTNSVLSGSMFALMARYYFGNSFFLSGGLGQRLIEGNLRFEEAQTVNFLELNTESSSTVAIITIGNVWSWDNGFFLGAEWLGASVPMSSGYSSKTSTNLPVAGDAEFAEIVDSAEDLAKEMGEATAMMSLLLNIGFSF
tara:strand:- start:18 stop:725 length:708 start_codon:yes stop_codon:yes gene_type:complete